MRRARRVLKPLLALAVLLASVEFINGQYDQHIHFQEDDSKIIAGMCASDIVHELQIQNNPDYLGQLQLAEQSIQNKIKSGSYLHSNGLYTIPIVVHVIHLGESIGTGTNISDAQIQSAIDALNEDYRKMPGTNGDGNGVDIEIEFCLAARDPNGNSTNGINRVNGSSVSKYADEGIGIGLGMGADETAVKSLSNWPTSDYYNIWIVSEIEDNNGGGGIQGFAYFPNGTLVDGATIMYNAFGTVGNLKSYTSLNRVATHEIGHGLSLYHTFQGQSCNENDCSTDGDKVCDTPPTTLNSNCTSAACGGSQQVENYMDYTSESCQNMFTQGQKDRMRASLETLRSGLISSLGCTPVTNTDVAAGEIVSPTGNLCTAQFEPVVTITNVGSATINSLDINYQIDSGTTLTYNWTGTLTFGNSTQVTLPSITASNGTHILSITTSNPNGIPDENSSNDQSTISFDIINGNNVGITVVLDNYGSETTWELLDSEGSMLNEGGPYGDFANGEINLSNECLADGCYEFIIYDSAGDGLCCNYGTGSYEILGPDGSVLATGGSFTNQESNVFCIGSTPSGPSGDFSASMNATCSGLTVDFSDISTGSPTSWNWTFTGATPSSSTDQHPSGIVYSTPGVYDVILEVTNSNGTDIEEKTGFIIVTSADIDIIVPVINAETSKTVEWGGQAGSCLTNVNIGLPSATDNCQLDHNSWILNSDWADPNNNDPKDASGDYPVGTTTITWTVMDVNGNVATHSMDITVEAMPIPTGQAVACLESENKVEVSWDSNPDAAGYRLIVRNKAGTPYLKKQKTVFDANWTSEAYHGFNFVEGGEYKFKVYTGCLKEPGLNPNQTNSYHIRQTAWFDFSNPCLSPIAQNSSNSGNEDLKLFTDTFGNQNLIVVHPNPTNGKIYYRTDLEIDKIIVSTLLGKQLFVKERINGENYLDLSVLKSNVYLLQFIAQDNIITKRVVVE